LVQGNIKDIYKNALRIGELGRTLQFKGQEKPAGHEMAEHLEQDLEQDLKARFLKLKE
jgi:hypothetical protein